MSDQLALVVIVKRSTVLVAILRICTFTSDVAPGYRTPDIAKEISA